MLTVSIVIVNWNTKDLLSDCILSIPEALANIPHEVIVVDNASGDGSRGFIEKRFPNIKLINNSVNKGFASACNQGALNACGRYIFFLNPDTTLEKDSLKKLIEFSEKQSWLGAAGPQLTGREGKIQNSVRRFPRPSDILIRDTVLKRIIPFGKKDKLANSLPKDIPSSVEQVSGAAFLIRRDLFRDIGGMDERFFMFYEEVDLCRRLKDLNYKNYYLPSARIIHKGGGSRKKDRSNVFYYSQKSMFRYLKKYEPPKRLFWFKVLYKPLFLFEILLGAGNQAKRDFLKKWLIDFIKF